MIKRKRFREKGKKGLSKLFREFKEGDKVMLINDPGASPLVPHFRGMTATVVGIEGKTPIVRFLNGRCVKKITVKPVYLKKLK
jgi:ribosomal protein L21E